jgi:hypothetical protein
MRFFYLYDKHRQPTTCVATEKQGDEVIFAVATLNPLDKLKKRAGRGIAATRLSGEMSASIHLSATPFHVKLAIVTAIAQGKGYPGRSRKAAKRWIREQAEKKAEAEKALAAAMKKE